MSHNDTNSTPRKPTFIIALEELQGRKLTLPPILLLALRGEEARPLAIGSYELLTEFAAAHAYSDDDVRLLRHAIANMVRSAAYNAGLSADGAMRYDLDANPVAVVSETDRLTAQLALSAIGASKITTSMLKMIGKLEELLIKVDASPPPPAVRKQVSTIAQTISTKATVLATAITPPPSQRYVSKANSMPKGNSTPTLTAEEVMKNRMLSMRGSR